MTISTLSTRHAFRSVSAITAALLLLNGCGAPERLPADLSIETSKEVLKEKVIAPIEELDGPEMVEQFEMLPRRKLLQVRHSPGSLSDKYFLTNLEKLLSVDEPEGDATGSSAVVAQEKPTSEEQERIAYKRAIERSEFLVDKGLTYEGELLDVLRTLDTDIETKQAATVGGLGGASIPVFGRNLTGQDDTFLEMPNDLIFVGGENGTISSKTALLKQMLDNPEISFSVREMPLPEALLFLFQTVGLQAALSDAVQELDATISISVQASAIAIIDALLEQNELTIVYDPAIEVAQVYTEAQFTSRIVAIRTSIENYNQVLKARQDLAKAEDDRRRVREVLSYVQLLLSGDDEGFMIGMESISREPAGPDTSAIIAKMTRAAITLRSDMASFDAETADAIEGKNSLSTLASLSTLTQRSDLDNIMSQDECIWPRQEIYTEKVAIYHAIIEGDGDDNVVSKINNFFAQTRPAGAAPATPAEDDDNAPKIPVPDYCGTANPAPRVPIVLADDTGITVIGTREDNDLVVRLIEQYDVPELQVLIEIFLITVSRDFSRQIDSILSANPSAGGNNVSEAVLGQVARAASTTAGTFNVGLTAPNSELSMLLNFLETNQLGRVVSSPTILVSNGQDATITRNQIARVPGPTVLDADNRSVAGPPVEYEAPFTLGITGVDINRLNNTVKLNVELTDTRFNTTLANVDELSDRTSDEINTTFWAAPGDVVVLAGLTRNEESTTTSGAPGTTGALAPLTPLLGGSDAFSTVLSETIIFMAPTVIDPSSENQPHSAFRKRPNRQ